MNQYTYHTTVLNADGDFRRMIKPSALFRYVEQAAADHARAYGMDDAFFKAHHTAFLVGKQAAQITRMPLRAEKLTFLTACEPCKKGSMKRLTRILDEAGKECALIDSRWIVVDTDRECILRQPSWYTPGYWNEDLDGELPQLVHKAKELTCAGSRTASYSLCDLERPCEQRLLSGHCLRCPAAGGGQGRAVEICLRQVPPGDPAGQSGRGVLCALGRWLVCGGPPRRARRV